MPSPQKVRWTRMRRAAALALVSLGVASCGGHGSGTTTAAKHDTPSGSKQVTHASGSPTLVAKVPFPTNLTSDRKGGLWVSSGSRGQGATDGLSLIHI